MIELKGLKIYVNGVFMPADQPVLSAFDRGFLYGDAVFEGIREYGGKVFKLREHLDRLYESAYIFRIPIPLSKEEFERAVLSTLRENSLQDAHIRPIVSRGIGVGVGPDNNASSTVVILAHPWKPFLGSEGIRLKTAAVRKIPSHSFDSRVKCTGSYVNGIMAKLESNAAQCDEALLLDQQGFIAEGPGSNFFIVKNGTLLSPLPLNILDGITRRTVCELAEEAKIPFCEKNLTLADAYACDEAFVCGTGAEICPVREIDGRYPQAAVPGPITHQLMKNFRSLVNVAGTPV